MRKSILHAILIAFVVSLVSWPGTGLARSRRSSRSRNSRNSNRRNGDRGFTGRIIDRDGDDRRDKDRERKRKVQEERKRKTEERKKKAEEKKRAREEQKKAFEAKRKERAEKAKQVAQKRTEKKATTPKGGAKNTQEPDAKETEAAELLGQAEGAFGEGKLLPGVKVIRQLLDEYAGTTAAADAQRRLDQLLETAPFGGLIYLGEAEELFGAQRYRQAQNKYLALLDRFPDGEQAASARKRLAEIREGGLLSKTRYTEEEIEDARLWLLAGNIHLENGRRGDALSAYRTAAENYPGCPYAKQAEQRLTAIR